jgi:hypothetical protein
MDRALIAMCVLVVAGPAWAGDRGDPPAEPQAPPTQLQPAADEGDPLDRKTLTAAEIDRYVGEYVPAIKACYLTHRKKAKAATGALRLELIIHRDGTVFKLAIAANGIVGAPLRRLESCVRKEVERWHFPVRRGFTSTVIPFFFLRTESPGAGPIPSCWSPRGCPARTGKPDAGGRR